MTPAAPPRFAHTQSRAISAIQGTGSQEFPTKAAIQRYRSQSNPSKEGASGPGGGRGIRTPGAVNPAVFKTAAIDHSAIPPRNATSIKPDSLLEASRKRPEQARQGGIVRNPALFYGTLWVGKSQPLAPIM